MLDSLVLAESIGVTRWGPRRIFMEAKKLPIIEKPEVNKETRTSKNDRFTKLQGTLLILGTLIISLVGGYFISDKYLWSDGDQNRLAQQLDYYKD